MSNTPRTDALREVVIGQYKEDELTGDGMGNILSALTDIETLERERDAARERADTMFAKHAEILDQYRRERDAERALADRLAEAIQNYLVLDENIDATTDELNGSWEHLQSSLTAWKEARSE